MDNMNLNKHISGQFNTELEAVRNNVLLSLLSTVASSYIDLRGTQMRLDVAQRNVAVQQQTLDLVLLLNKEGAATELDVARARSQLLTSQASIPVLRAGARAALNRLTTLTSQPPGALDAQLSVSRALPTLPEKPSVSFENSEPMSTPPPPPTRS